jgi:aryl-alcohol dehydrogenase-like predicted oxidoreductase
VNKFQKIGLGTAQFGLPYGISNEMGRVSENECQKILKAAKRNGLKIIDTAPAYGEAEKILGQNDLADLKIVSKFMPENKFGTLEAQLEKSLIKLNTSSIYAYISHRPMDLLKNQTTWEKLQKVKAEKRVDKIGFSLNMPQEIVELEKLGYYPDLIQVPYNFFDQRFKHEIIRLKNKGCEIHARSVFLQGLFFTNTKKLPSYFDEFKTEIKNLQEKHNNSLPSVLLNYVLNLPFIDHVITGVQNHFQLNSNIEGLKNEITLKEENFNFNRLKLSPINWPKKT